MRPVCIIIEEVHQIRSKPRHPPGISVCIISRGGDEKWDTLTPPSHSALSSLKVYSSLNVNETECGSAGRKKHDSVWTVLQKEQWLPSWQKMTHEVPLLSLIGIDRREKMTAEAGSHEKPPSLAGMPPSGCQSHNPREASHGRQLSGVPLLSCTCLSFCQKSLLMPTRAQHTHLFLWEWLASTLFRHFSMPTPSGCAVYRVDLLGSWEACSLSSHTLVVNDWEICQAGNQYPVQRCQIKLSFLHSQFLLISQATRFELTAVGGKSIVFSSSIQNCDGEEWRTSFSFGPTVLGAIAYKKGKHVF